MDWQSFVHRLRAENTSLLVSLKETHEDLMQSRREKHLLEDFIQRQATTTDAIVSRQRENINKLKEKVKKKYIYKKKLPQSRFIYLF
jgi:hypothetical protein